VLPLAAVDAMGVLLFGTLYAVAGAELLSLHAFLGCLLVLFGLVTTLWSQAEARNRALPAARRVSRAALGLTLVVFAMPALLLMPLFWLDSQLPEEAGVRPLLAPAMTILLVSLILILLVNLVGSTVAVIRAVLDRRRRASR
jgi:Flp pilus assembly protein TadB